MIIKDILMVGLGGFVGSALRYAISFLMAPLVVATSFPWATLSVNLLGSLAIGVVLAMGTSGSFYFFCVAGLCGGFTTFSTLSLELFEMIRAGETTMAVIYLLLSICIGVVAVWAGFMIGDKL